MTVCSARSRSAYTVLVLACAIVLTACDGSTGMPGASKTDPAVGPTAGARAPTAPPEDAARCPNESAALQSGTRIADEVQGDVDGDGGDDSIFLVRDDAGPPDCRTFLVAQVDGEPLVVPTNEEGVEYSLQEPRVHSLAQIDDEGGFEILVDLEQGASTRFLGIFTVVHDALRRVEVQEETQYGNLFPYGGSVGQIEASDCASAPDDPAEADVALRVATANVADYTVRTRLYDMLGARLEPLPPRKQPPISTVDDPAQITGLRNSPFGECDRPREGSA